jgi:hypothetical protein
MNSNNHRDDNYHSLGLQIPLEMANTVIMVFFYTPNIGVMN